MLGISPGIDENAVLILGRRGDGADCFLDLCWFVRQGGSQATEGWETYGVVIAAG